MKNKTKLNFLYPKCIENNIETLMFVGLLNISLHSRSLGEKVSP